MSCKQTSCNPSKIAALERTKQRQDEEIAELRQELSAAEIHHKEELYWLRLELDNLRRENAKLQQKGCPEPDTLATRAPYSFYLIRLIPPVEYVTDHELSLLPAIFLLSKMQKFFFAF